MSSEPTTTQQPTTTNYQNPTTTNYQNPTTTNYQNPTTTNYQNPTTTNYQNPTTTNPSPTSSIQALVNDIISIFPSLSQSEITNLINSGVDISSLMNTCSSNSTLLNSDGINLSSQFKGPSTNIVQIDFKGTSNIYSPYLYYNKGTSEKFESIGKHK